MNKVYAPKGMPTIDGLMAVLIAMIVLIAVLVPVTVTVVSDANVTGITKTILDLVPLFLGIGALVMAAAVAKGR